jgi:hypothetical protein
MTASGIHPNAVDQIADRIEGIRPSTVWGMLLLRPGLALALQCLFAAGFAIGGQADPWRLAADWWLGWLAMSASTSGSWPAWHGGMVSGSGIFTTVTPGAGAGM